MFDLFGERKKRKRTLTQAQIKHIISAVGSKCEWCGERDIAVLDVHHIKPVEENGPDTPSNLIVLCKKCHGRADKGLILRGDLRKKVSKRSEKAKKSLRGVFQKKRARARVKAKGELDFGFELPNFEPPKINVPLIEPHDIFGGGKKKKSGKRGKKKKR